MANVYEVSTNKGNFNVKTDQHHEDRNHTDATFRQHLIQIVRESAPGVVTGIILHHYKLIGKR